VSTATTVIGSPTSPQVMQRCDSQTAGGIDGAFTR
jgi:hypothetical protein